MKSETCSFIACYRGYGALYLPFVKHTEEIVSSYHKIKHVILCLATILFAAACRDADSVKSSTGAVQSSSVPPVTVLLDTSPAKTLELQAGPPPGIIQIPKAGDGFYTIRTVTGEQRRIGPPITTSAGSPIANFTTYNTEQGLALSTIACGWVDRSGNLWFGTAAGGVSRYNGKSFTTFTTRQGLAHNTVRCIVEDSSGNLWFGTGGGVSRYDGKSFTTFTTKQGLAHNVVWSILKDKKGNLWFGTFGGGISRYDGKSFITYTTEHGLAHNTIRCIAEDKRGNLWFGTDGGGVSGYDGKSFTTFTTRHGLGHNVVWSITEDISGNLWFGTEEGGVSRYDGKSFTTFTTAQGLAHNAVRSIAEDKNRNLWFGTGGGVSRYDGKSFTTFNTKHGLANNDVRSITEDKSGNLWLGTEGGGVSRYDGTSFTMFTDEQGLAHHTVRGIVEDKSGNLWFCTDEGGVSRYDGKSFTTFATGQGLAHNAVWSATEDKRGNLWFNTWGGGVSRYDGQSFTSFTTEQGLASNAVLNSTEDRNGDLWFGTNGAGVSRYNGKSFTTFTTSEGLANNDVRSITEDKNGDLWFGTNGGGVSRYNGKSFTTFTTLQGLADNVVWSIAEDKSGNLWFGTGGGVSRFDGSGFATFTTSQGLADDVVKDIAEDGQGVIWFGTNQGFSGLKFNTSSGGVDAPQEIKGAGLLAVSNLQLANYTPVWEIYNKKTGYPVRSLNLNAMCITKVGLPYGDGQDVGTIWGGCGDNKVIRFDPKAIATNSKRPEVFIQSIKIDETTIGWYCLGETEKDSTIHAQQQAIIFGKLLSPRERESMQRKFGDIRFDGLDSLYLRPENLVLPYRHNRVSFDFGAIETGRVFLVRYQYILEGYDKEWSPVTDKTSVTFGNVDEGTYTFKLKARSPEGVWSEQINYTFEVLPPWWRAWWAYTGYSLLGVGLLFVARRNIVQRERLKSNLKLAQVEREKEHFELEKAKEVDKVKSAFFTNISHEFRTPLTLIKGPVADMLDEYADNPRTKEQLKMVQRNSDLLLRLINQLLDLAKLESGSLTVDKTQGDLTLFLSVVTGSFSSLASQKNVTLATEFPSARYVAFFDKDKLETILINLINNAIKFTPAGGKVNVKAYMEKVDHQQNVDQLTILVLDTGIGIPKDEQTKIFERFHQVSESHKEVGTGIGLSLVKELTSLLGGDISVTSETGKGSSFKVTLPIELVHLLTETEESWKPNEEVSTGDIGFEEIILKQEDLETEEIRAQVLVVEDNADLRRFIINSLGKEFYFLEAGDGKQGIDKAFETVPDVIISDVMMPGMDGITMTGKLKRDTRTSHIPIILLTAKTSEESKLSGLGTGADDYIIKPFNKKELLLKVRNIIALRAKLREKIKLELLQESPKAKIQSADEQFLWTLKEAILARLGDEQLSVESLAEEIGLSRAQLFRKTTALTGVSVNELIQTFRLQKAAQLLEQNWGSLTQIAYEVGFSNLSYFNKVFKEQYGVMPSVYSSTMTKEGLE